VLDKGYDSNAIRERLAQDGIDHIIPPRSNRKDNTEYEAGICRQRNQVERFFNRIKHFRRMATCYEKYACTFLAMVQLHRRIPIPQINSSTRPSYQAVLRLH